MKRILFFAALLIVPTLFFTGCKKKEEAKGPQEVKITVWARASETEHWRADGAIEAGKLLNAELEKEGSNITVVVDSTFDNPSWGDYKKRFTLAADAGEGPDIVLSGHEDVAVWAQAEYIMSLADSVSSVKSLQPEFADVIESLWTACSWREKVWAVPQDVESRPMFFSKPKLKALGWSDAEIEALPDKIKNGEFTLDDLIATAKEAVDKGVVPKGFGYWHRPRKGGDYLQYYFSYGGYLYDAKADKLVVVKDALEKWYAFQRKVVDTGITPDKYIGTEWRVWHDTVSHDKALFWNGGVWQWAEWALLYLKDEGGEATLFKNVGYALQPSGVRGKKGGTLSHPLVYMVTTEAASRRAKEDTELVIRLLAKMTTKEINTKHAIESTHLGILKSQMDYAPYKANKLLADVTYMLDYNYYQPNHSMYSVYFDSVWTGMSAAENGEKSPKDAAAAAIKQLQVELGDALIVK